MQRAIDLLLFSDDLRVIGPAVAAGVAAIVVDLERTGKNNRQAGADTQITNLSWDDVRRVRSATAANLICRINAAGASTAGEVALALDAGADEILLPMIRSCADVEATLGAIAGRGRLSIMMETRESLELATELARMPVTRAYVGLNDLAIALGNDNIFTPLIDGTVDRIRTAFQVPFGFGGLTVPPLGHPIPTRLLMGELARLRCGVTVLRRSFLRDVPPAQAGSGVASILASMQQMARRSRAAVARDHAEFVQRVQAGGPRLFDGAVRGGTAHHVEFGSPGNRWREDRTTEAPAQRARAAHGGATTG